MKKLFSALIVAAVCAATAQAQMLVRIHSHLVEAIGVDLAPGAEIVSSYWLNGNPEDPFGDGSVLQWANVPITVTSGDLTLYSTLSGEAGFLSQGLYGFTGFGLLDGMLQENLLSTDPSVMDGPFLKTGLPISVFDNAATGFIVTEDLIVSWTPHTYEISAVPEPSTYGILAAGLLMLGVALRRRRRAAA